MNWKVIVCSIAVIFGGCPKRQTGPKIVYVPTAPPAATSSQSDQSIVVQAPAPPAPAEAKNETPPPAPPETFPSEPLRPKRAETKTPPEEKPTAEIPALQSALNSGQASQLQEQVVKMQHEIEKRILVLSGEGLSSSQRGTLEAARGFLQNSHKALQESDFQRALNLAQKADILVASLEQTH